MQPPQDAAPAGRAEHAFRVLALGPSAVLVNGRNGTFLVNPNDPFVGRALMRYGEFSRYEAELFEQLCGEGDVVVEAGANIGSHTVGLARSVGATGHVVAVEPQAQIYYLLCANVALNGLRNVNCVNAALGKAAGVLYVPQLDYDRELNFGALSLESSGGAPVSVLRLDDTLNTDRLRLIKIDVEGMELEVLQGAERTIAAHRPLLYLENDRVERSFALISHIRSLGYRLWWHTPPLFHPDNFFGEAQDDYPGLFSFNMLCAPKELPTALEDLPEVDDPSWHPLKR